MTRWGKRGRAKKKKAMTRKASATDEPPGPPPAFARALATTSWAAGTAAITAHGQVKTGNPRQRNDQAYDLTTAFRKDWAPTAHAALIPATAQIAATIASEAT